MIDKSAIDPNALQFYRMLKESGFSAYFVGGSVRDLLLGKEPKDFDIATNATPQQIKRVIPQGRIIGRRFRHVMLEKNGGRYEIVTFRGPVVPAELEQAAMEEENIEAPLANEAEESNGRRPRRDDSDRGRDRERRYPDLNQFGNAEQDALRRDFTINALFYDPDADELVDYVEGKLDIDRRIIRTIGEASIRMEEDPIRILRAIRHKMKLGLDYDPALEAAMRDRASMLTDTSKDRIREEFLKVCNDQSMVDFLKESQRLGLAPFIMPWFEEAPDESWAEAAKLWEKFREADLGDRPSPDLGLALMMIPLVEPLVLKPYRESLKEGEQNYLPDMKYFLSCEPLRNFYLRNLRISRAQTDYLVRALFYYNRMNGLWMEQGPPRRIVGRLFQHPSAVLAAKMSRLNLQLEGKETPEWLAELADFDPNKRRRQGREGQEGRGEREPRREHSRERSREEGAEAENDNEESGDEAHFDESEQYEPRERRPESAPREKKSQRLPPPDQPMVWNGPLHAPVLRPIFSEEPAIRWARKNQTVRAFRPSGIPNQPVDHSLLKSNLVYNYKPEMAVSERGEEAEGDRGSGQGGSGRGRRRERGRGRGRDRDRERGNDRNGGTRGERGDRDRQASRSGPTPVPAPDAEGASESGADSEMDAYDTIPASVDNRSRFERAQRQPRQQQSRRPSGDDDSIGNLLRPGEQPAALGGMEADYSDEGGDSDDDNIGNRLDAPPTSGHVGVNGDGFLNQRSQSGSGRSGPRGGSSGGQGGGGGNNRRRGRRRGRRGGGQGGGGGGSGSGGGSRGQPRGNFSAQ